MNKSFINSVAGWPPVPYSVRFGLSTDIDHESGKVAPLGLDPFLLQHPVLHRTFGVYQTDVGNNSDNELVPSTGYHLFKTQRRELFEAQSSIKLELYLFRHGRPGSQPRHIFHSFRSELHRESRLQSDGKPDASVTATYLWLRQWKGWSPSRPCWSLREDSAAI